MSAQIILTQFRNTSSDSWIAATKTKDGIFGYFREEGKLLRKKIASVLNDAERETV